MPQQQYNPFLGVLRVIDYLLPLLLSPYSMYYSYFCIGIGSQATMYYYSTKAKIQVSDDLPQI